MEKLSNMGISSAIALKYTTREYPPRSILSRFAEQLRNEAALKKNGINGISAYFIRHDALEGNIFTGEGTGFTLDILPAVTQQAATSMFSLLRTNGLPFNPGEYPDRITIVRSGGNLGEDETALSVIIGNETLNGGKNMIFIMPATEGEYVAITSLQKDAKGLRKFAVDDEVIDGIKKSLLKSKKLEDYQFFLHIPSEGQKREADPFVLDLMYRVGPNGLGRAMQNFLGEASALSQLYPPNVTTLDFALHQFVRLDQKSPIPTNMDSDTHQMLVFLDTLVPRMKEVEEMNKQQSQWNTYLREHVHNLRRLTFLLDPEVMNVYSRMPSDIFGKFMQYVSEDILPEVFTSDQEVQRQINQQSGIYTFGEIPQGAKAEFIAIHHENSNVDIDEVMERIKIKYPNG